VQRSRRVGDEALYGLLEPLLKPTA
jgi:hypothetical protein